MASALVPARSASPKAARHASCAERGWPLVPVPGACAAVAALSVCARGAQRMGHASSCKRGNRGARRVLRTSSMTALREQATRDS